MFFVFLQIYIGQKKSGKKAFKGKDKCKKKRQTVVKK